ncbi:Inner membrane permease YgbN [Rubripirellula amarantea]|uniref:Inner membrane permease YgbN n=1 Tax=Rubripirellula amarantea TaxID=2527999 RepID=A0A5C5WJ91_9BACT|nr:GntP family permease [Rubripirellula amarantea]TWT50720.1 Inner membrane permease YgbN [Rubripirellula amarantea]
MIVLIAVITVLVCILVFRLHAFLTLLLAAFIVALLSDATLLGDRGAIETFVNFELARESMTDVQAKALLAQSPASRLTTAFGETVGKIGILIALASVIGQCLLESKAASVIVDRLLKWTGPRWAPEAMALSSFVLAIPVFFDTVFYLMLPLARSLRARLGKDLVLFILAILAGGSIAHSLVPPTPGPLLVAGIVGVDIGTMMIAGLVIGSLSSLISMAAARLINRTIDVPLRAVADDPQFAGGDENNDLASRYEVSLENAPGIAISLTPIFLPVVLIAVGSVVNWLVKAETLPSSTWVSIVQTLGDKNVAIALGLVASLKLISYVDPAKRGSLVTRSLASAGNIILITSAGGAFGVMLRHAGIEQTVAGLAGETSGILLLPLAFVVTATVRTLQGSATVAMITSAGILQGFATPEALTFHPVYLAMAIGAGSKPISWMTDSAFWVITRMSGMSESEGLRTISPMSICLGFSALAVTMFFAMVYPGV